MSESEQIQTKGLKRDAIDKFYTRPEIAESCIHPFCLHIQTSDLIIEPSAGNGAFIEPIQRMGCPYRLFDIAPEHPEIERQNYLEWENYRPYLDSGKKIRVIGNPPFGRQSSTAIQFIKKSCEFAQTVAFILPKSFKKESMQKKSFPPHFHLVFEMDLPENAFLVNGEPYDVPCVFQIWERKETPRTAAPKEEPRGYVFVKKTDAPHISVRRVGVYAGKVDANVADKSEQSHYFIRFVENNIPIENLVQVLNTNMHFAFDNTVGPKSISKPELIRAMNRVLLNYILI